MEETMPLSVVDSCEATPLNRSNIVDLQKPEHADIEKEEKDFPIVNKMC